MSHRRSSVSDQNQMRSVADSLKPTGSRFDNEISYEINGCILTWIANDEGVEYRFDCSNIIEIIDGYYKAEFYLDTKRIFEAPNIIDSYDDNIEVELTGYIEEEITKKADKRSNIHKIYTISSASTEAESLHENTTNSRKDGGYRNHSHHSSYSETRMFSSKATKSSNSNHTSRYSNATTQNKQVSKTDKIKDKSPTYSRKNMETRKQSASGFNLRSTRTSKAQNTATVGTITNIYSRENTRAAITAYSRVPTTPKAEEPAPPLPLVSSAPTPSPPDPKRRKYPKSDPPKKKQEVEVRRGERIRKVSIFQDCYIPAARNEWISEVFIGAHKENF